MFQSEPEKDSSAVFFSRYLFSLTILIIASPVLSGPPEIIWERTFTTGLDCRFWGVDATDDGGAVCTGETASDEITSLLLAKYTPQGTLQWKVIEGRSPGTSGQDVLQVPGGYIVCGKITSGSNFDGFAAMFDYFGNILWFNRLENPDDEVLYDIARAGDSCYVAAGYTESTGAGKKDALLVLFDTNGNLIWTRSFGTAGEEIAYSVKSLSNGGFALAGGSEGNFYIVITDKDGLGKYAKTFDHGGHEIARTLLESSEGGFFLTGSTMENGSYQSNIWLLRTDTEGNEIWSFEIGGDDNDSAWDAIEPETGGYIVLGNTMSSGSGNYDAVLYRIDPWGNIIWQITAGDSLWNTGSGLSISSMGNLLFAGRTQTAENRIFNSWLVFTTPEDLLNW